MATPEILRAVIAAVNAGRSQAFLDLFAPDGVVADWGTLYRGREAIKTWSDRELIGANAHFTLCSAEQDGNVASMTVIVGGDGFTGPSRFSFTLAGNLIQQMRITPD